MSTIPPLIQEYYRGFNERRFEESANLLADDAEIQHRPGSAPLKGREGYLTSAGMATTSFPDIRLEIVNIEQRGDTIFEVQLTATGTHAGDWAAGDMGTLKATGKPRTFRLRETLEIRGGKITFSSLNYNLQDLFGSTP